MWLGPIFHAEMVTLARRPRFYVARFLYGLLILGIVTLFYEVKTQEYAEDGAIPVGALASVGVAIFAAFAVLQGAVVLIVCPALVAGAIADERQRKTLHYLMTSRLTGLEIVGGKAAARLLRLGVVFAIGAPILALTSLFGGVELRLILVIYAATATTGFFLAAGSLLGSVYAPRPRDAIAQAFLLELIWLGLAPALLATRGYWRPPWTTIGEACLPALDLLADLSPSGLLRDGIVPLFLAPKWVLETTIRMMATQLVAGSILLALAAWRLRPAFRGIGGPGLLARLYGQGPKRARFRLRPRPAVGDRAMLWKEMHLNPNGEARGLLAIGVGLVLVGVAAYSNWNLLLGAVAEIRMDGYWAYGSQRRELNGYLRLGNALLLAILEIGLGAMGAASVTAEREGDTWTGLAAAPLDGLDVVGGKIVGVLWQLRPVGGFLVGLWAFGLAFGAIHPYGVLISVVELAVFAGFAASLGVATSLWSKNTIQATATTLLILFATNYGYLMVLAALGFSDQLFYFGCTPYLFASSLMGGGDRPIGRVTLPIEFDPLPAILAGTFLYAVVGVTLALLAIRDYDRNVDRPDKWRPLRTAATIRRVFAGRSAGSS